MPRGSAPGERRGGRDKGTPNSKKKIPDIKSAASMFGKEALERVVKLMKTARNEQVKLAAAKEIMDRAYGKPAQAIVGDDDGPPVKTVMEIVWGVTSGSSAGKS
jgi:hypothetical protein